MNRIVREHYPASKLPDDLREGLRPDAEVRVVIEEEHGPSPRGAMTLEQMTLEQMFELARPTFRSADEVGAYIKAMRDEWDRDG